MGSEFWKHYDQIYAKKDYDAEVAAVLPLLKDATILLEVGCGTGEHTKRFAPHFQSVIALDMDEDAVEIARKKKAPNVILLHTRVEDFRGTGCSGAVALFNVVHYLQTEFWLKSFMESVAKKLKPGSPFVFDCWNCEAVLNDPPKEMVDLNVRRITSLNREARTVDMEMQISFEGDDFTKTIHHRLWTIKELTAALTAAGFVDICVAPWMRPAIAATPKDWKIMFICEKGPS